MLLAVPPKSLSWARLLVAGGWYLHEAAQSGPGLGVGGHQAPRHWAETGQSLPACVIPVIQRYEGLKATICMQMLNLSCPEVWLLVSFVVFSL